MGKTIGFDLIGSRSVMWSDEDHPVVYYVSVGFNPRHQLMVAVDRCDDINAAYECSTAAVVDSDDAAAMARRHRVRYSELPGFIAGCMEEWRELRNPGRREIRKCFREILECLLDERCRFEIVRTYGRGGISCM